MIQHNSYFLYMKNLLLFIFVLTFMGCPPSDPVEQQETEWLSSTEFDYLQSTNELYFSAQLSPAIQGSNLTQVNILWYCSSLDNEPDTIALNDNGFYGDILPGDDRYSIKVDNDTLVLKNGITPTTTGTVFMDVAADYESQQYLMDFSFQLGNLRPSILNVVFPDTLYRPDQPNTYVVDTIKVLVHDPNGLSDIQSCFLLFQKPDSSYANSGNPIMLYDDGNQDQQIFLWDESASDGIFSRLITIGYNNPLGTYTAEFYVRDISGDYGETVTKTLEVVQ